MQMINDADDDSTQQTDRSKLTLACVGLFTQSKKDDHVGKLIGREDCPTYSDIYDIDAPLHTPRIHMLSWQAATPAEDQRHHEPGDGNYRYG